MSKKELLRRIEDLEVRLTRAENMIALLQVSVPEPSAHTTADPRNPRVWKNEITCDAKAASWAAEYPVRSNPSFTIPLLENDEVPEFFPDSDDIEEKWD